MSEKNGTAKALKIIAMVIVVILAMTGYIVANDLNSRNRDEVNREYTHKVEMKVSSIQLSIETKLATLINDVEYIKKKV